VHAANEMTDHFFPLEGGKDGILNFLCSHHVPNDVPQVPNSTSLYLIFFAQSSPLLTYVGEPKGRHSILA
jgi:hypothetical protein